MYKKYYSPFEQDVIIKDTAEIISPKKLEDVCENNVPQSKEEPTKCGSSLLDISSDDIILVGILLLLLLEQKDNRDIGLILGIGFLLFSNYI